MASLLGGIFSKIIVALLTEKVVKEIFVNIAWYFAEKSSNSLDDKMVKTIGDALSVKVE